MTTYAKQYYLELIKQQIEANSKDADELMVQRLYDVPGLATIVLAFIRSHGQVNDKVMYGMAMSYEIEKAVFAAIEKSPGEMAEIEAMQTPDPEDFDDVEKDGNAMLDLQGARRV